MDKSSKILVTGANGHVGFNIVAMLLQDGYTNVRVSVRDKDDPAKTTALADLGISDIVSLDIRDANAFRAACQGVSHLFHVAATYRYHTGGADADAEMIKDSVSGVRSAMTAAAENGVKKVILTSSVVTLPFTPNGAEAPDEDAWTTDLSVPYIRAKTEAEKLAWEMAKDLGLDLVTVLPGAVLGPHFGKGTQSTDYILGIMKGSMQMGTVAATFPVIDSRDVARGHILAAEKQSAGRYIIAADNAPTFPDVIKVMRTIDSKIPRPMMVVPRFMYSVLPMFDWMTNKMMGTPRTMTPEFARAAKGGNILGRNDKAKRELGWSQSVPLDQTLRETMAELKAQKA